MPKALAKKMLNKAYWLLGCQGIIIIFGTFLFWIIATIDSGLSFFLGGIASLIPSLIFTRRVFKEVSPSQAKKIVANFYRGEIFKLILMSLLFIIFVKLPQTQDIPLIIGFISAQMAAWLAPFIIGFNILKVN